MAGFLCTQKLIVFVVSRFKSGRWRHWQDFCVYENVLVVSRFKY
jgi:hypothetical protein